MRGKAGWVCRGVLALGVVSAVVLAESSAVAAQSDWPPLLTVQPRTMATGTQNPVAGGYWMQDTLMNGLPTGSAVYVPPACVGAKRCPLLVFDSPGNRLEIVDWLAPVLERYGMILLVPMYGKYLDDDLKETLRRFAIDPEKIAIVGHCGTGGPALQLGAKNLHVFSRMASMSGNNQSVPLDPQNTTAEVLIDEGIDEGNGSASDFNLLRQLEQAGHPTRHTVTIRDHAFQAESFELLGRWLHESWAKPPAERAPPAVIALPLLTPDAVARLTAFWTRFLQLPDSAWAVERRVPYLRDVLAEVGQMRTLVPMTDMTALAAKYPSVAAALKAAGLTGEQHDTYRLALATAMIAWGSGGRGGGVASGTPEPFKVDSTSVLAQNMAFLKAHLDELQALEKAGANPDADYVLRSHPATREPLGPLGIWLTP